MLMIPARTKNASTMRMMGQGDPMPSRPFDVSKMHNPQVEREQTTLPRNRFPERLKEKRGLL